MGDIISYQLPSPDGPVTVGVGLLGLTFIHMPPAAARDGAVLQSSDVVEAMVDADATLAQRYRQQLRERWLDDYLEELRDEIKVEEAAAGVNQLELFNADDYASVVVQQHDVGI